MGSRSCILTCLTANDLVVDSLFRSGHIHHLLCRTERIRSGSSGGEWSGTLTFSSSVSNAVLILLGRSESDARIISPVRIGHQLPMVPTNVGHFILEQDRCIQNEVGKDASREILPRVHG